MFVKIFAVVAALSLYLGVSTGAAGDLSTAPGTSPPMDASPLAGTVVLWAPDGDATVLDTILEQFQIANPDLDVEITLIPADEYNTKLRTAIAAGTTPDVAQLYTETQAQFLDERVFAPVPAGVVDASSFHAASWGSGVMDGIAYSVPWYTYTYALIYRSDLAAAAGVGPPSTIAEMVPFFEALQSAGAERGFGAYVEWDYYNGQDAAVYTWQNGGDVINTDQTAWTFADNPAFLAALAQWQTFFTSGTASVDGPGFLDTLPYFVDSKIGAIVSGPWNIVALDMVADEAGWTAENVATAPLPAGSAGNVGPIGGGSWAVFNASENADAAWKLIQFMSQVETQVAQYQAYGSMPSVIAGWDDPSIADEPLLDAFFSQLQNARTYPTVSTWSEVATELGTMMEAVARGVMTPEAAADAMQSFADRVGVGR